MREIPSPSTTVGGDHAASPTVRVWESAASIGACASGGFCQVTANPFWLLHESPPSTPIDTRDGGVLSTNTSSGARPTLPAASVTATWAVWCPSGRVAVATLSWPGPLGQGGAFRSCAQ